MKHLKKLRTRANVYAFCLNTW